MARFIERRKKTETKKT